MRVWAAGCTVMAIIAVVVLVIGERRMGLLTGIALAGFMVLLCVAATVAFNWQGRQVFTEQTGKLESRPFRATRCFQVEEFEDEGSHYFLELEDGSVLYLTGQYLYDYEPVEESDDEPAAPRRFPCTSFTVRTNLHDGYTVDILCDGTALEPEVVAPPFTRADYRGGRVPDDRAIVTDRSYDELKVERLATA